MGLIDNVSYNQLYALQNVKVCEDFFDEILSQGEGGGEGGLLDHLVKDEPLGEDDVRKVLKN